MTYSADDSAIIFKVCHDILAVCISWEIIHCAMSAGKENCVIAFIYQVSESFCLLEKFCHFGKLLIIISKIGRASCMENAYILFCAYELQQYKFFNNTAQ